MIRLRLVDIQGKGRLRFCFLFFVFFFLIELYGCSTKKKTLWLLRIFKEIRELYTSLSVVNIFLIGWELGFCRLIHRIMGSLCFVKIGSVWLVGKSIGTIKTRKVFKFNEILGVFHSK